MKIDATMNYFQGFKPRTLIGLVGANFGIFGQNDEDWRSELDSGETIRMDRISEIDRDHAHRSSRGQFEAESGASTAGPKHLTTGSRLERDRTPTTSD
jgi:hypothetical protein